MGTPALTLEGETASYTLPSAVNGTYGWMSQAHSQDCLWTDGPTQYAVWVDDNRKARIAKRTHTRSFESSIDLSGVTSTAFSAQFANDSHNVICIGVDERGYVHLAGDMHGANPPGTGSTPLKYMRTTQPGSLNSWVAGSMVGTNEGDVAYPQFFKARNGKLHFLYRDGLSGNGNHYINGFASSTKTWTRVCQLFDGQSTRNAYPQHVAVNRTTGRWHVIWTWRDGAGGTSAGAEDNTDLCYAYTDDDGVTWKKTDGTSYTLPITAATSDVILDINDGSILNQGGLEVDAKGYPHAAIQIKDGSANYQLNHVYYDGSTWHKDQLTSYGASTGRRPSVACFSDGRVWIMFNSGSASGYIRKMDVTRPSSPVETVVYSTDVLNLDTTIDTQALYTRDRLYIAAPVERSDGLIGGEPADIAAQLSAPVLVVR